MSTSAPTPALRDAAERYTELLRETLGENLVSVVLFGSVAELALKAVLRASGIEVPRVQDVGIFLVEHAERLPPVVTTHLDRLVSVSRRLRQEREISFYGDEEVGAPPDRLYSAPDAEDALREARFILTLCEDGLPAFPAK